MLAGVSGGIALALDVEIGFIDRLVAAPIPRWAIVVGRLAGTAALGLLAAVWFLVVGAIFGARVQAGAPGVLVVLLLAPLAAVGFGGLGAAVALWSGRASVVQGIFPLVFVILFMSSAFFPRDLLLEPASTIAGWNPLSYIAEALRDPVISDLSPGPLLRGLAGLGVLGGAGAAVCAWALRSRLETR
jgi:ABC-2 type transport system permease protein